MSQPTSTERQQAWIDQELSTNELIEFEQQLSPEQKQNMLSARTFQRKLGEQLKDSAPSCPKDLWNDLKSQMSTELPRDTEPPAPKASIPWRPWAALAAGLCIAWLIGWQNTKPSNSDALTLDPIAAYESGDYAIRGSFEKTEALLHHYGYFLEIDDPKTSYHPITYEGLKLKGDPKNPLIQLIFSCCDEPVIITLHKGEKSPKFDMPHPDGQMAHQIAKVIGNTTAQALSYHDPKEVLAYLH